MFSYMEIKTKILIRNVFNYDLTFNIDLCRGVVCSQSVGRYTGVPAGVVFKCFSYHQSVQVTITTDLDIRAVVQLPPLTKPPVQWKREDGMSINGSANSQQLQCCANMLYLSKYEYCNWEETFNLFISKTIKSVAVVYVWERGKINVNERLRSCLL